MTPFRNDDDNPFSRPSVWPKMPQAPMSLGALPRARTPAPQPAPEPEPRPQAQIEPVEVVQAEIAIAPAGIEVAAPEPLAEPEAPPIAASLARRRRARPAHQPLRLTPLIAAAAVGAGGVAALFLVMGVRPALTPPRHRPRRPPPWRWGKW